MGWKTRKAPITGEVLFLTFPFIEQTANVVRKAEVGGSLMNFAVAPDGKRIAALMAVETIEGQKAQNQVTFLENFFHELRTQGPRFGK